jgi:hypothetical protein
LIESFQAGSAGTVPPILTMPLTEDESRLLVLDGNHRADAAFAAGHLLLGIVCRSSGDLEAVGQRTAAAEAMRQGFLACRDWFRSIALSRGWYDSGFAQYLRIAGLSTGRKARPARP